MKKVVTGLKIVTSPSWKPRRRGDIYCAPACGCGCKRADYELAVSNSKMLAACMGSYKPRVWENGGWHYSVKSVCEKLEIHTYKDSTFSAFLNTRPNHGGRWVCSARTPQLAVKKVLAEARKELRTLQETIEGLS